MVLYLSIIIFAVLLVSGLNILFTGFAFANSEIWFICAMSLGVVIEFCIDGIAATIVHSLPNRWFTLDKKIYNVSKKERKFYDKLKIKSWKDKVWELGALGGFRKNKINDPNNPKYIEQFIIESNKGFMIHVADILVGFLILLYPSPKFILNIGLPIALVNTFLNLLSILVLRYNIPRLVVAYQRAVKTYNKKDEVEKPKSEAEEVKEDEVSEHNKKED